MTAGGQTAELFQNIAVLMPANLEFTLRNTGDQPLGMYVINEPTPPGFRPNADMLVRDENKIPISVIGFWAHITKPLFVTADGLGTLESVLTVTYDPLTIGKPHPAPHEDTSDIEEVWTALYGTSLALVGNQLREQTPGMALYHPPDNLTPHTNINPSSVDQVKFLYFARYRPHETRKQQIGREEWDRCRGTTICGVQHRAVDRRSVNLDAAGGRAEGAVRSQTANATAHRIDLYFGHWHDSAPRTTRGSLEERNILTRGDHIPDNQTPHTSLNPSQDSQAKFFYFARYHPFGTRK